MPVENPASAVLTEGVLMIRCSLVLAVTFTAALTLAANCASAKSIPANITSAVADANRPDADKQRDANRKPAEALAFAGVKPAAQIAEFFPAGGYFTRILSKAVGSAGHVYALVPERPADAPADMADFAAKAKAIAADPNYSNVTVTILPFSKLAAPVPVDLVWTSLNYHDLHNIAGVDPTAFNKLMFDSLKPGGIYLVLDHAAAAGSGARDTKTLHRIDPETVKAEVLAAGFKLVGSSDLLHQSADDHTLKVFDPAIRGKTDQFILKFRKPTK
jgi:predicted methyltransferase